MANRPNRSALSLAILCGTLIVSLTQTFAEEGGVRGFGRAERSALFEPLAVRAGPGRGDPTFGFRHGRDREAERISGLERAAGADRGRDGARGARWQDGGVRHGRGSERFAREGERRGSFIHYRDGRRRDRDGRLGYRYEGPDRGDVDAPGFQGNRTLTTFDDRDWRGGGSVISYGAPPAAGPAPAGGGLAIPSGPRIIDVATQRLDRRPIGPSGIEVVETGGAKIIRIAPGYRMADAARARKNARDLGLQPWSSGWLSWCAKSYRSFDPELGTHVARDGSIRFCQPE